MYFLVAGRNRGVSRTVFENERIWGVMLEIERERGCD
jgi:hypothetical protein